ncbi:biopolymer transporter ExbB [Cognatishimia sp. MH4019]|uniref:biopolymer transporter ExbB n=1 Tax=Cognatishimia sp. MH4019 TaxID=2854030 RepID=UPI001CD1DA7B|nr:biopolymer transporter ExbB [Cognatishimia sp. MH4019]
MALTDLEAEPYFSRPRSQVMLMLVSLGLVGVGVYLALPRIGPVFYANPYLNGFIVLVFALGVLACFWQVLQLISSVRWIEGFASQRLGSDIPQPPALLATLAAMLRTKGARSQLNATSTRSILESVATRIDEAREITRYIVNLLIFLGLLGTFYGLATTVPAMVDTIQSLNPEEGEGGVEIFGRLMGGLESQLSGMGVAFASSLLGLAGSLIVGLLELFAGHGQNRFYRELEDWLSTITRVGFTAAEGESGAEQNFMAGVLDHMSEQMDGLRTVFLQSDASRAAVDDKLTRMTEAMALLTQQLAGQDSPNAMLARVAEGQERLIDRMDGDGLDAESRMRLRSIDVQLLKISEELAAGRQDVISELRADLGSLTRALAAQPPKDGA